MHLLIPYPKTLSNVALSGLLMLWISRTHAVQLNFSAVISSSTCTFNLSEGMVNLGSLTSFSLQPATLVAARPFTLAVTDCSGITAGSAPVVNIIGEGVMKEGRWLFRSADSVARNIGVMLLQRGDA